MHVLTTRADRRYELMSISRVNLYNIICAVHIAHFVGSFASATDSVAGLDTLPLCMVPSYLKLGTPVGRSIPEHKHIFHMCILDAVCIYQLTYDSKLMGCHPSPVVILTFIDIITNFSRYRPEPNSRSS